jgi:uncharacterized membrane protein
MQKVLLYGMTLLYVLAGLNHFIHPSSYLEIMPAWLPLHEFLVLLTGLMEILFAGLLLFARTRRIGAWCIILLLIAIFPANLQMTLNYARDNNPYLWITILRLPLQILLVWWAWQFARKPSARFP